MRVVALLTLLLLGLQDSGNYGLQAAYDYFFSEEERAAYDALGHQWDRDRFWLTYWQERDPTPETEYNELREEFLTRYDHANYVFSRFVEFEDGWKSDMGRVYIIFGPPRDIYRSPEGPSLDPKYEVWVYRIDTAGNGEESAELIFQDDDGDGEFDLMTEVEFPRMIQDGILPKVTRQAEID